MTCESFAALLKARQTGKGKWQAQCPAHADRSPSLSICEGRDGRVLVHCFAKCSLDAVLAGMGLARRDLFHGPAPSPEQAALIRASREAREQAECFRRKARREARYNVTKWEAVVNALGARLARAPDDNTLAKLFQEACGQLHELQMRVEQL